MRDAIRRVLNIMYTANKEKKMAILSLDALKAFDWVEWKFMFDLLEKLNMGKNFIKVLKELYTGAGAVVLINGL